MSGADAMEFLPFPKIVRLSRECIITEKIDGTNAQVFIGDDGSVRAGSRNGWTTDNFGFAAWVKAHEAELHAPGPGRHFGEWWGRGIQRGYGLNERRFSLFNITRWGMAPDLPLCCHVVPTLYRGLFRSEKVEEAPDGLRRQGSLAAPGFMRPEGVVVYHIAAGVGFKKTLEKDDQPKGREA